MAIPRGHRFDIGFDSAFPQGLVLIGDVTPDNEYQKRKAHPSRSWPSTWATPIPLHAADLHPPYAIQLRAGSTGDRRRIRPEVG
jgi:hypothetical protein